MTLFVRGGVDSTPPCNFRGYLEAATDRVKGGDKIFPTFSG